MSGRLVTVLLAAIWPMAVAASDDLDADIGRCRTVADPVSRLACYDALADGLGAITFSGAGSYVTPAFQAHKGNRLFFENMDAVLVIYLLDADGAVVQNLHKGGAGSGSFVFETDGTFSIQIDATGRWKLRIDA